MIFYGRNKKWEKISRKNFETALTSVKPKKQKVKYEEGEIGMEEDYTGK